MSWSDRMMFAHALGAIGIQAVVFLVGIILSYRYLPGLVHNQIMDQLVISPESDLFDFWRHPPLNPDLKLYLFHYANVAQWLNGSETTLKIAEVGPIVYQETWIKSNIEFDEGLVTYDLVKVFHFQSNQTRVDLDQLITVPNVPLLSAAAILKESGTLAQMGFQTALQSIPIHPTPFVSKTLQEVMWGYEDPLVDLASAFLPPEEIKVPGRFGIFSGHNGTSLGRFSIRTGSSNPRDIGRMVMWNNLEHFDAWNTHECNKVSGYEGMVFPIDGADQLNLFVPNMCRSLPLVFQEHVMHYGIKSMRFVPHGQAFDYEQEQNHCYCDSDQVNNSTWFESHLKNRWNTVPCVGNGLFDVGPCKFGAPLVVSWPHFLYVDPLDLVQGLQGLDAKPELHSFSIDLHPELGLALSAMIRLQLNVRLSFDPHMAELQALPTQSQGMVLPLVWFENSIQDLPEDLVGTLRRSSSLGSNLCHVLAVFLVMTLLFQLVGLAVAYLIRSRVNGPRQRA